MTAYADTSFLVSLYVLDANSTSAAERIKRVRLPLLITPLVELELTNAFSLRVFRKELSGSQVKSAHGLFRKDIDDGALVLASLGTATFERAKRIARTQTPRYGARTVNILHVASALILQADDFCTFDQRQAILANAEGLHLR